LKFDVVQTVCFASLGCRDEKPLALHMDHSTDIELGLLNPTVLVLFPGSGDFDTMTGFWFWLPIMPFSISQFYEEGQSVR